MEDRSSGKIFDAYCYGPADVLRIRKGDSTMWLTLRDSAGRNTRAIYRDCVYWRLDREQTGIHLSLVQRVTADQLLDHPGSPTLVALQKNAAHVDTLLRDWEAEGLAFFLHFGSLPDAEYLVVAGSLEYREPD